MFLTRFCFQDVSIRLAKRNSNQRSTNYPGTVARSLQSFFNLQSLIVPYQKFKPPEQKKSSNLFTLPAPELDDKTIYKLESGFRPRHGEAWSRRHPSSKYLVEQTTASILPELEHRMTGYNKQVPLVHFYNQSFIPQFLPMPWMSPVMYPYRTINPIVVPMQNMPSNIHAQPFTQMPLYPYNVMPKVPVLPVYNYFSRTKNDALYPSQNNPEFQIPYYISEEDWNKYEGNLKNQAVPKSTTLRPAKSTEDFIWTKFKQNPAAQFIQPKLQIPTSLYHSNSENNERGIQTVPLAKINKLQMNAPESIVLNPFQDSRSLIKPNSYPGAMVMSQLQTVPDLYGGAHNPMAAPSYPYMAQMNPNLVNPFLFSYPLIGYGYPNGMPNIPPMNAMGNPYVISQIPSIPYNPAPMLPAPFMPPYKEMDERKHLLNLIDGNPDRMINTDVLKTYQFTSPLVDSLLSENIKTKRQNELTVVNKISALKAKEQMAEMNRRALFQKAKAADEEYVRKLNKELNLITEWKLANLSAEESFQKLMANKRQLSEQECEVHRVKEAENELYGELLQSQAELAIADMQLIPSIPSEVILRQFLSGMNYDRPMDVPPAV